MEVIRAFAGEAGPLEPAEDMPDTGFILSDLALARELQLSAKEAEEEAKTLTAEQLEEMNRALDEYILRQMCFKSEIVDEIARLHEDSAYAILGVTSAATDAEIKRAYRLVAMQCHPDKGGDKEDFQELTNAYEKIMEQRRPQRGDRGDEGSEREEPAEKSKRDRKESEAKEEASKSKDDKEGESKEEGEQGDGNEEDGKDGAAEGEGGEEGGSSAQLLEKASKAAEEASRYAKTAAEFAHQAADAAETARQGREQGSHETLTKSIAHSAIVLTLTVVKAVRVVGYATLDVAAQCRAAAKRNPAATECAEKSQTAMSLGLEALNAALACAEVTETTAAQLQAPASEDEDKPEDDDATDAAGKAADRFVSAAVRASLAAASASNAAMSAAIAAVEGSRQCTQALGGENASSGQAEGEGEKKEDGKDEKDKDEKEKTEDAKAAEDEQAEAEAEEKQRKPSPEEVAANAAKRLVAQRHNNHKVLQRLNAEILGHQKNVREFLQANRQLIPEVSNESKQKVAGLLQAYAKEARGELVASLQRSGGSRPPGAEDEPGEAGAESEPTKRTGDEVLARLHALPMLVPFLQPQNLAIPVSVKARIVKMAALHDLPFTMKVLDEQIFSVAKDAIFEEGESAGRSSIDKLQEQLRTELCSNVAEEAAVEAAATAAADGTKGPAASHAASKGQR